MLRNLLILFLAGIISFQLVGCVNIRTQYRQEVSPGILKYTTKKELLQSLGSPTEIKCDNNEEIWIYTDEESRWGGVFLFIVIVPIPLMAPIGGDSRSYLIQGDTVVGSGRSMVKVCQSGFALAPSIPLGKSGAYSYCYFPEHKVEFKKPKKEINNLFNFCLESRQNASK